MDLLSEHEHQDGGCAVAGVELVGVDDVAQGCVLFAGGEFRAGAPAMGVMVSVGLTGGW
ncbi:MAG: hypothetical protein JO287_27745 [Pseudonocardiales bacterium]|nr:hypothetical protein [Pseudonocardiales bacterium]